MLRTIGTYGMIGGLVAIIGLAIGMTLLPEGGGAGMAVGYLTMLIAMSMVFMGVRNYRDSVGGGVIRFWPAFGLGLGIALVASLFYAAAWEIYLWQTGYTFMNDYVAGTVATMRADGTSEAEIAAFSASMEEFKATYAQPHLRVLITLSEIVPVGLLVALVSAALLRNPRRFPARTRA